jgi:hypothetical protein
LYPRPSNRGKKYPSMPCTCSKYGHSRQYSRLEGSNPGVLPKKKISQANKQAGRRAVEHFSILIECSICTQPSTHVDSMTLWICACHIFFMPRSPLLPSSSLCIPAVPRRCGSTFVQRWTWQQQNHRIFFRPHPCVFEMER